MKFTTKLLVLLFLISMASISLGRRIRRNRNHSRIGLKPADSKYYQLAAGILLGAANTTDDKAIAGIDVCLPLGWQVSFDATKLSKELATSTENSAKGCNDAAKKTNDLANGASKDVKDSAAKILEQSNQMLLSVTQFRSGSDNFAKVEGKPTKQDEDDAKAAAADKDGIKGELEKKADKGTFDRVLDIVEGILNFVCKFKDKVKSFFTGKFKRYYRRLRRRNFVTKHKSKYLMSSTGFWDDVTGFFSKIGDYINKAWDKVTDVAAWIFDKIKSSINEAVDWVKGIINSPFIQKIITIVNCVSNNMNTINQIISTAKGIAAKIALIATGPVGIVAVFIDLLCNLHKFREAFEYLSTAKELKDPLLSWKNYGFFVGKLLYAIAS